MPENPRTVAVFGANGPSGRELTQQLLDRNYRVVAITRHPDDFPLAAPGLTVVKADATDPAQVARALDGVDVVTSVLGTTFSRKPIDLYSVSGRAILAAMGERGIRRLIVTTSMGTTEFRDPESTWFDRAVLARVLEPLGRTLYEDMRRLEALVAGSDVDWTVMRPLGLASLDRPTEYAVARDHIGGRLTTRHDLASAIVDEVESRDHLRSAVGVATTNATQSLLVTIWREGLKPNLPGRRR